MPDPTPFSEPFLRIDGEYPSQSGEGNSQQTSQQGQVITRNSPKVGPLGHFPNHCLTVVVPPRKEIFLGDSALRHRVINDRRRFVSEPLPCRKETPTEFGVFVTYLGIGPWPQIGAETTVFFECAPAKCHVDPVGGAVKLARIIAQIEIGAEYAAPIHQVVGQPRGWRKFLHWKNSPRRTGPLTVLQWRRKILQP